MAHSNVPDTLCVSGRTEWLLHCVFLAFVHCFGKSTYSLSCCEIERSISLSYWLLRAGVKGKTSVHLFYATFNESRRYDTSIHINTHLVKQRKTIDQKSSPKWCEWSKPYWASTVWDDEKMVKFFTWVWLSTGTLSFQETDCLSQTTQLCYFVKCTADSADRILTLDPS